VNDSQARQRAMHEDAATVAAVLSKPHGNGFAGASGVGAPRTTQPRRRVLTPVRAPARAPLPILRDAIFRRLLAIADLAAAAGGLAIIGLSTRHGIDLPSMVTVPLIVVIAKMTGRYEHDELVLRKSTLDEIPSLLALAGAFALTWSIVAFVASDQLHRRASSMSWRRGASSG